MQQEKHKSDSLAPEACENYTGLCSAEDWERNSDKTRELWAMIDQDQIDGERLEQAEHQVKRFLEMFEEGITTRKKTIAMLKDLASKLDKSRKDVNVTVTLTGILRYKVTDLEHYSSFDTPSPLDGVMKMEDAQKKILECYSNLAQTAETISASNPKYGTKEHVLCSVLLGSKLKGSEKNKGLGINLPFAELVTGMGAILTSMSKEEFGQVIARIKESQVSQAAEKFREIAHKCEGQLREMEKILVEIEKNSKERQELVKNEFRELLQEIASKGYPSTEEVQLVLGHLFNISSDEWRQAFRKCASSPEDYVAFFAVLFKFVLTKVQQQQEKHEEVDINDMDVTFIAHGAIVNPKLPCSLYYVRPELTTPPAVSSVNSITLYEPWGCAIDAWVVHGIATGLINIEAVDYTDRVLPQEPRNFNTLPNDDTLIPMVIFTHVKTNEDAYRDLLRVADILNVNPRGLVIPYFQSPGTSLPEIPLWELTNVLDVISYTTGISFNLHVAACLTTGDTSLMQEHPELNRLVVDCDQYCTVPATPTTQMTWDPPDDIPQPLVRGLMDTLNNVL